MKTTSRAFTLIELLVVIAIIGILSSIVMTSLNTSRAKSRDSHMLADAKNMRDGLELAPSYNDFFTLSSTAGRPTLTDTDMQKVYADAVAYAPTNYNNSPFSGSGAAWVGNFPSLGGNTMIYYPIVISTDVTPPATSWGTSAITKYAIYARLSTGYYFCIDSSGVTNQAASVSVSTGFTNACP